MSNVVVIAIDGPAAAGKGTLARRLAGYKGFAYLDTGAIYRAVALRALKAGANPADPLAATDAARALDFADLDDPQLRTDQIGAAASILAAFAPVRQVLLDFQRDFARNPPNNAPGAILDGRDIATVICPQADLKLYITASPQARAHRRFLELSQSGKTVSEARVLSDLLARDAADAGRAVAPMRPARDAHLLDTTNLAIDDAFAAILDILWRAGIS